MKRFDLPAIVLWLKELHSNIWCRGDRKPNLFRRVEKVTQVDYVELQKRLKELHPDRDLPDYDGVNSDGSVLGVKAQFPSVAHPGKCIVTTTSRRQRWSSRRWLQFGGKQRLGG